MLLRLLPLLAAASLSAASVSTFAGNGQKGYSGDGGPATSATMNDPFGVVRGPDGAIWYCEYGGQRIRRVDKDGKITLIAGNGKAGYTGDGGPATAATFNLPHELRFGPKRGNPVKMNLTQIGMVIIGTALVSYVSFLIPTLWIKKISPAKAVQFN